MQVQTQLQPFLQGILGLGSPLELYQVGPKWLGLYILNSISHCVCVVSRKMWFRVRWFSAAEVDPEGTEGCLLTVLSQVRYHPSMYCAWEMYLHTHILLRPIPVPPLPLSSAILAFPLYYKHSCCLSECPFLLCWAKFHSSFKINLRTLSPLRCFSEFLKTT